MTAGRSQTGRTALIVLGMHRSGTSAMSRVLSLAGAGLPSKLMLGVHGNEDGHWEPQEVADLNDRILESLDSSWDDPLGPRRIGNKNLPISRYVDEAREVIKRNYSGDDFIVLKEPRVSILFELWNDALRAEGYTPACVIMVRHPAEVAASLKRRDNILANKALLLWANYMLSVEIGTRSEKRVFVSYDDLIVSPEEVLDRLEASLDVQFPRRTWESVAETEEYVKSERRHHWAGDSTSVLARFPEIANFYEHLHAAARGAPGNLDAAKEVGEWLNSLQYAVGPILKRLERELQDGKAALAAERNERAVLRAALDAAIARDDEGRERITETAARLHEAERQATQLQSQLSASEAAASTRDVEVRGEVGGALARLHDMETEVGRLRDLLSSAELEIAGHVEAGREALADLERLKDVEREAAELRDRLAAAELAAKEELRVAGLRAEAQASMEAVGRAAEVRCSELTQALSVAEAELLSVKAHLETVTVEQVGSRHLHEAEIRALQAMVLRVETEAAAQRSELESGLFRARSELKAAREQSQDLARALAKSVRTRRHRFMKLF